MNKEVTIADLSEGHNFNLTWRGENRDGPHSLTGEGGPLFKRRYVEGRELKITRSHHRDSLIKPEPDRGGKDEDQGLNLRRRVSLREVQKVSKKV